MKYLLMCILLIYHYFCWSQRKMEDDVILVNSGIDNAIVIKDLLYLNKHYAEDFVFTHGTGHVDSKSSWIKAVQNKDSRFQKRVHDSVSVERHDDIAIVTGSLDISRNDGDKFVLYGIRYVRVFRLRKNLWQMISHRTVKEWHF